MVFLRSVRKTRISGHSDGPLMLRTGKRIYGYLRGRHVDGASVLMCGLIVRRRFLTYSVAKW